MKKIKLFIVVLLLVLISASLVGCKDDEGSEDKGHEIYQLAQSAGFTGSYEEWMNAIQGIEGTSITSIDINDEGELIITLSTGAIVNAGKVKGDKGIDGVSIIKVELNESNELIIYLSDGQTKNLGVIVGKDGTDGVGVESVLINDDGDLIVNLSNGTVVNAGSILLWCNWAANRMGKPIGIQPVVWGELGSF